VTRTFSCALSFFSVDLIELAHLFVTEEEEELVVSTTKKLGNCAGLVQV